MGGSCSYSTVCSEGLDCNLQWHLKIWDSNSFPNHHCVMWTKNHMCIYIYIYKCQTIVMRLTHMYNLGVLKENYETTGVSSERLLCAVLAPWFWLSLLPFSHRVGTKTNTRGSLWTKPPSLLSNRLCFWPPHGVHRVSCLSAGSCLKWSPSRKVLTCLWWAPSQWAWWGRLSLGTAGAYWSVWWLLDSSAGPGSWSVGRHRSESGRGRWWSVF